MTVNFDFIIPRLATGGALGDPADVETLVTAGITHVVDCTDSEADANYDDTGTFANHPALAVLWNPTLDDGAVKEPSWFEQSVDFAMMALAKPNTAVYTHCTAGMNRGPSTAFAILLMLGFDYNTAISMIHTARPITVGGIRYAADAANGLKTLGYIK